MLNIGDLVREYRVAGLIGRGETGAVYRVLDAQGRPAAMKVLDWSLDDVGAVARMRKEAAAAQALRHPNICGVETIFVANAQLFIVMELLEGTSLDLVIANRPLSEATWIAYARQIASALEALCQLHRDFGRRSIRTGAAVFAHPQFRARQRRFRVRAETSIGGIP